MISSADRAVLSSWPQSLLRISSFGKRLDPMPTQVAPALNHFARFSAVGSTPPVTMMLVQGMGPLIALMKPGPNTLAGKSLTTSAPSSSASDISVMVEAPGIHAIFRRLHTRATSLLITGATMKLAPSCIYKAAVGRSEEHTSELQSLMR